MGLLCIDPVGEKGNRPPIGRPTGLGIVLVARGELARFGIFRVDQLQVAILLLGLGVNATNTENHPLPVG